MSDQLIGEVRIFPGKFLPEGWLACDGRTLQVEAYQALFSVISNRFGGDGRTNFKLPNLNGRAVVGAGKTPGGGGQVYEFGKSYGTEFEVLTTDTMPSHSHQLQKKNPVHANAQKTSSPTKSSDIDSLNDATTNAPYSAMSKAAPDTTLDPATIGVSGNTPAAGHENRQPYLAIHFGIAYEGDYPVKP